MHVARPGTTSAHSTLRRAASGSASWLPYPPVFDLGAVRSHPNPAPVRLTRSNLGLPHFSAPPVPSLRTAGPAVRPSVPNPGPIPGRERHTSVPIESLDWDDRSVWATATVPAFAPIAPVDAAPDPARESDTTRSLSTKVATAQAWLVMVLLVAAPVITLFVGKRSGIAFAMHGIGAVAVAGLATMAMHKAYPLMRGGARTWPAFQSLLGRLAIATVAQAASSLWILHYYLAGPHAVMASVAAPVDGVILQFKISAGFLAFGCFIAAWWSARHASDERGDPSRMASVFAMSIGWMLMVCALVLGTAISWVMPV